MNYGEPNPMNTHSLEERLGVDLSVLETFCFKWQVTEMAVFGSALRQDFRPESDIDLLVAFAPDVRRKLWDMMDMEEELRGLLGRGVDIVERNVVEKSRNYIRRREILSSAQVIYAASTPAKAGCKNEPR